MKIEYYESLSSAKRNASNKRRFAVISILIITTINLFIFKHKSAKYLPIKNIIDDEERLLDPKSKNLFFIETHLSSQRKVKNARDACSIESAARTNPDYNIYLILATNEQQVFMEASPLVDVLLQYPNINIRYANLVEYSMGTPLEHFFSINRLQESKYPLEHTSDVLRALTLFKYGGVYLDMDVLSTFPLRAMGNSNFACLQGDYFFSNGLIGFDIKIGRKYTLEYIRKIEENFNPSSWDSVGPSLVTEILLMHCNQTELYANEFSRCDEVSAFSSQKCFLTDYDNFYKFFEEQYTNEMFDIFRNSRSFFIHIWNKMLEITNKSYVLDHDSKTAYMEFAKLYCPNTVATRLPF